MYDGRVCGPRTITAATWRNVMGKIASAIVAATLAAGPFLLPAPARAENGQIAAGVVGGLIGGGGCRRAPAGPSPPPAPGFFAPGAGGGAGTGLWFVRARARGGYGALY